MSKLTPFQRLQMIRMTTPDAVTKAAGTPLSILEKNDAEFVDILIASDGCPLVLYKWKDDGQTDHLEMTELQDEECEAIIKAIKRN